MFVDVLIKKGRIGGICCFVFFRFFSQKSTSASVQKGQLPAAGVNRCALIWTLSWFMPPTQTPPTKADSNVPATPATHLMTTSKTAMVCSN